MADVPVVDFAPFRDGGVQGKTQVAAAIRAACEGTGFFYLSGHGVPASAMAGIFAASRRFFALPIEERLKVKLTPRENRGYQPLGSRIYADKADAPDQNESYKYQHEFPPDDVDILDGGRVHARNRWPDGLPGWRETLIGYYDQMERLTDALLRAFALALDLPEDYFVGFYRKALTQINLLHYPPQSAADAGTAIRAAPAFRHHRLHDPGAGRCRRIAGERSGDWIDVPPIAGTFVINIGDMMARWTNDRFASTPHRVINRPEPNAIRCRSSRSLISMQWWRVCRAAWGRIGRRNTRRCGSATSCRTATPRTGTRTDRSARCKRLAETRTGRKPMSMRTRRADLVRALAALGALAVLCCLPRVVAADMIGNCEVTGQKGAYSFTPMIPGQLTVEVNLPSPGWWNGDTPDTIKDGYEYCMAANIAYRAGLDKVGGGQCRLGAAGGGADRNFDLALSEASITEARKKVVDFSVPYFSSDIGILVKKGTKVDAADHQEHAHRRASGQRPAPISSPTC